MTLPRGQNIIKPVFADKSGIIRNGGGPTYLPGPPGPASTVPGPVGPQGNPGITGLQSSIRTTDASGNATFTFSPAYVGTPTVEAIPVNSGAEPIVVDITSVSNTAVTIRVWQAQKLPATISTLATLQNFDIFGGTGISGISVHVTAVGT